MLLPHFTALGAGPTVLMLHGAAGGYRSFAPQVEHYASQGWRAVAWDMPGDGLSAPVEPYGVPALAQRCMAHLSLVTYRLALRAQAAFDRDAALERMAGKIAGSRWVQMPGIGHWQNLEAPDAFDALVLDFLHQRIEQWLH